MCDWKINDVLECTDGAPMHVSNKQSSLTKGKKYTIQGSPYESTQYPGTYIISVRNDNGHVFGYYTTRFSLCQEGTIADDYVPSESTREIYDLYFYKNPKIDYFTITKEIAGGI